MVVKMSQIEKMGYGTCTWWVTELLIVQKSHWQKSRRRGGFIEWGMLCNVRPVGEKLAWGIISC